MPRRSIAEILADGVSIQAHEAVAVLQGLIEVGVPDAGPSPPVPPTLETVRIDDHGGLACEPPSAAPSVLEAAFLLHAMLPQAGSGGRVPGALRYTLARALQAVDAPPFDSMASFVSALRRHENGDRRTVLRNLHARSQAARPEPSPAVERRQNAPSTTILRRFLREADEALYIARTSPSAGDFAAAAEPVVEYDSANFPDDHVLRMLDDRATGPLYEEALAPGVPRRTRGGWLLGVAAAVLISFALGYGVIRSLASQPRDAAAGRPDSHQAVRPTDVAPTAGTRADAVEPRGTTMRERPDGPETLRLVRALDVMNGPAFSPSFGATDDELFFHTGGPFDRSSALSVADLRRGGQGVRTVVDDGARNHHLQPSPDGSMMAFDSDRDGERGVYLARSDGSGIRRVSGTGYAAVPTWSPDGSRLAFVRSEPVQHGVWNLWLLSVKTGALSRLTHFGYGQTSGGAWFRSGNRIAYAHEAKLYVHDLAAGSIREYRSPIPGRLLRSPAVSPDGLRVVVQVAQSGVWLLHLSDGQMRSVLADPSAEAFAWAPDGRTVAFHSRRDGQWGIWFMPVS